MYEITQRIKQAAESILENERLTADLDDEAANVLLNWGVARAEEVAGRTDGLSDFEAEEFGPTSPSSVADQSANIDGTPPGGFELRMEGERVAQITGS